MENKITPETADSLLIEHYLKGNEIALEYIINKHQQKIFNFIYSKVHDRDISEDIFQETFIKVIKTLKNGIKLCRKYTSNYKKLYQLNSKPLIE